MPRSPESHAPNAQCRQPDPDALVGQRHPADRRHRVPRFATGHAGSASLWYVARAVSAPPQHPVSFPAELPISARVHDIALAIHDHPVVVVAGETGSGKTTQLPKICLAMGRGLRGAIACTQPRRVAACSVAARVAAEVGVELGREVGYKIRFHDKTSADTYVKFATDGILLAELQGDPDLRGYDTIIVDEAHERSLNIDFLLGYLRRLLPRRPDLRVVISSATLETDRFASFFHHAPVIEVSGRTFPVEVVYHPPAGDMDLADCVASALDEITEIDPRGDVLVFLPGEREIRETCDALLERRYHHTVLLPLYGRMPQHEQLRVFQTLPERRIVLATNVAETSLTIPGIAFVVDSGLARIQRYEPRTGMTLLQVEPISRASAEQRKGRAGRLRPGVCYRLYAEDDYIQRPAYTVPEVQRVGLAGVILQMKTLGLGRIEAFPFLDPPSKRSVDEGYRVLEELGAIDQAGDPTDIGRTLARLPLDPRLSRMLLAASTGGCLREVSIIAAALSIQDPRERPLQAQKQADDAHRRFLDETSDFVALLKIWRWYQDARRHASHNQLRKLCREGFLSFQRMREWTDVHQQLLERCRDLNWSPNDRDASGDAIHAALLAGLLGRTGMWQSEKRSYLGARQTRFVLHPSSGLTKKPPAWVFAAEIVETSQPFARLAAAVDPACIERVAGALCKHSYHDPHWEQRPAQVVAKENVSLFGLPIVRDRRVPFAPVDPVEARRIFLVHALVRQELSTRGRFHEHNRDVIDQARRLRDKARRSDMLFDEDALLPFFDERVPRSVFDGKTFEAWRRKAESENPHVLELSLADVLRDEVSDLTRDRYPDTISVPGASLALSYRFDPSQDDDGISVAIPIAFLAQADPDVLEWTIPAWHDEKILLLLQSLPRSIRKEIAPVAEVASEIARAHAPFDGPMLATLAADIHALTGVRVPPNAWRLDDLPRHLRFFFNVYDDAGKTIGQGRDLHDLKRQLGPRARQVWTASARVPWERTGLRSWSFDRLPERLPIVVGGSSTLCYPALVDDGNGVSLRALSSEAEAERATRQGLRRLFLLQMGSAQGAVDTTLRDSLPLAALARFVAGTTTSLHEQIRLRAIDDSFALHDPAMFPRDREAFAQRFGAGRSALARRLAELATLAHDMGAALMKAESMLRTCTGKPGAPRNALDDIRRHMESLLPRDLFEHTPSDRLVHIPRYLRGVHIRLERLPLDPRRDAAKASQVVPLWESFQSKREMLRNRGVPTQDLESFRWLLEELRVAVFAPELRTAVPVSPARAAELWKSLSA